MTGILIINPGSGPVPGASELWAWANMAVFAADLGLGPEVYHFLGSERDGRYAFTLAVGDMEHDIEMPGLPVDRVRFLAEPHQDVWDFPRLYVDGSSWLWAYALKVIRSGS